MQMCQDHWHELKNAIRQRGLWKLVTPEGYFAAHISRQDLACTTTQPTLDPLITTSLMIIEQARMAFGSGRTTDSNCPLCEVEQNLGSGLASEWIDTDADVILQMYRERNVISREES